MPRALVTAFFLGFAVCSAEAELAVVRLDPPPGANDICSDTQLQLTFNESVRLVGAGRLSVIRTDNHKVVDVLDLAAGGYTNQFGIKSLRYEPVRIDGSKNQLG